MIHTLTHAGRWARLRAPLLALAVLAGACDSADQLATTEPAAQLDDATDPVVSTDSLAVASAAVDVTQLTPSAVLAEAALYASRSLSFGPEGLWADYTSLKSTAIPFTASTNYTDSRGIVKQISAARAKGQRLILNMTGGSHSRYKTDGKFDLSKWKAVMNLYNTREIKAAVAQGVSDGTVIMNTVMDEPSVKSWGGVMTKPLLDRMATYAKGMFPTLPAGVALRYDWRTHERFTVMDAYISQFSWWRGSVVAFRDNGMAEARRQGMKMVFALNLLDGGQLTWKYYWSCPIPLTGGRGTYAPACRMTASQVRDWGRILGPAGCGLITWRYDSGFMTNWANARALKDVAATLATIPGRSCRRS